MSRTISQATRNINNLTRGMTPSNNNNNNSHTRTYATTNEHHRADFSNILSQLSYQQDSHVRQFYDVPQDVEGTHLIQLPISDVADSLKIFGDIHPNRCIPVILTTKKGITDWWCSVPKGVKAMYTRWGKYEGCFEPGFHLLPPGTRVSWIVTDSFVPFDLTVQLCPTLDNVMVKIDIMIVFRIIDCAKFVFNLGPYKLSDIFNSFLEESVRSLARSVTYDEVYELRGYNLDSMKRSLNDKLMDDYGVEIHDIDITNVLLPMELQDVMQRDTEYQSKENCQKMSQAYGVLVQDDTAERELIQLNRSNERKQMGEEASKARALIQKECEEVIALTEKRLAEIGVEGVGECERIRLQGESESARFLGEKEKLLKTLTAEGFKNAAVTKAEADAYVATTRSKAQLDVADNRAKSVTIIGAAEAKYAKALEQKRNFELLKKRIAIVDALASNKEVVISGTTDMDDSKFQIWSNVGSHGQVTFEPVMNAGQRGGANAGAIAKRTAK